MKFLTGLDVSPLEVKEVNSSREWHLDLVLALAYQLFFGTR